VLAGCGGDRGKPAPPVRLSVDAPSDMALLRADSVEVHGVVSPATAQVSVEGKAVDVREGRFSANVALRPGTNLIDVLAGAAVPDLIGYTPSDARDTLAGLGLKPDVKEAGGLIELLLPEDARVCETTPRRGTAVDPGSTVTVYAAKRC
jgi:hypothetical protein